MASKVDGSRYQFCEPSGMRYDTMLVCRVECIPCFCAEWNAFHACLPSGMHSTLVCRVECIPCLCAEWNAFHTCVLNGMHSMLVCRVECIPCLCAEWNAFHVCVPSECLFAKWNALHACVEWIPCSCRVNCIPRLCRVKGFQCLFAKWNAFHACVPRGMHSVLVRQVKCIPCGFWSVLKLDIGHCAIIGILLEIIFVLKYILFRNVYESCRPRISWIDCESVWLWTSESMSRLCGWFLLHAGNGVESISTFTNHISEIYILFEFHHVDHRGSSWS